MPPLSPAPTRSRPSDVHRLGDAPTSASLPGRVGRGEHVGIGELRRPLQLPGPVVDRQERVGHRRRRLGEALAGADVQQPALDVDRRGRPDAGARTGGLVARRGVELPTLLARRARRTPRSTRGTGTRPCSRMFSKLAVPCRTIPSTTTGEALIWACGWSSVVAFHAARPWSGRGGYKLVPLDAYTPSPSTAGAPTIIPPIWSVHTCLAGVGLDRPHLRRSSRRSRRCRRRRSACPVTPTRSGISQRLGERGSPLIARDRGLGRGWFGSGRSRGRRSATGRRPSRPSSRWARSCPWPQIRRRRPSTRGG